MAVGDLNIALVLKLIDQATRPARAVTNSLQRIGTVTEQTGRAGVAWSNQQIAANQARQSALRGEAFGVAALAGSLAASLQPAIAFERSMAGVSKVIDFDTPQGLRALERDIVALTTSNALPMAAEGIADIIDAAGQAGVVDKALPDDQERQQLIDFAREAAQMGVAFNISAEASGQAMAQWRAAMGLSRDRSLRLGDAINHLSNNMNAAAPGLVDVIRRQGAVAMTAGLAETEIAALAASFLSGGASPEIAATALKNFTGALTAGEAMTARQRTVMAELGIEAEVLARRMQTDARGAIIEVMEALAELPTHARGAALGQLFGEESKGAIAPLLTNLDLLRNAFELVEDETEFAGSMLDEYAKQAATTANALKISINYTKALAITAGSILLPEINAVLGTLQPLLGTVTAWAEANPQLISLIARLTAGILLFRLGSIALRFVLFSLLTLILRVFKATSWLVLLLPRLVGALLALLSPLKLIKAALVAIRLAFIATGIGALLVGIAMAGIWVYNNWKGLRAFFKGFWQTFREALGPVAPMLDQIIEYGREIAAWFKDIIGPMDASEQQLLAWGQAAGQAIGPIAGQMAEWIEKNKGLVATVAKLCGAFLALRLILGFVLGPLRMTGKVFAWIAAGPIKWLLRGVGLIAGAFIRLGLLALANPIGLIIAAIAALALIVYKNWDRIVAFLTEKVETVRAAFDDGLLNGVFKALIEFNPFLMAIEGAQALLADLMELLNVPEKIVSAFRGFDLLKPPEWLTGWWDNDDEPVQRPTSHHLPPWRNGRDAGGPVRAGMPYIVGERSPELFVPGVSGTILPGRVLAAAMAASTITAPLAAMPTASEMIETVDRRPPLSAPAAARSIVREGDTVTIHIHAAPGMSVEDVGRELERHLAQRETARRADLHDGVDF